MLKWWASAPDHARDLAVVARPQGWPVPITRGEAPDDIGRLSRAFKVFEDGPRVTDMLLALCRDIQVGGRQVHDANIVATMLAHGERRLLTLNGADFRRYQERIELVTA